MFRQKIIKHNDGVYNMWNNVFQMSMDQAEWQAIRQKNYYVSMSVKLRDFQYRLISNKITTNLLRSKWNPEVDPQCGILS